MTASKQESAPSGYWHESARPLVSLVFVAPLLLGYEAGVLLLGRQAIRNGADVWMRQFLDLLGFSQYFLLPLLTCGILIGWHHVSRQPWRFHLSVLYGMAAESLAFGLLLLVVARWQGSLLMAALPVCATETAAADGGTVSVVHQTAARVVGFLGAGIYEELLFRLMLLPTAIGLLLYSGLSRRWSVPIAIAATSLLFSAAHYQFSLAFLGLNWSTQGDAFTWFSFLFRATAGAMFCLVFLKRGFGITAGAHALYDIFTVLS